VAQIAVINQSEADDVDVAFAAAALDAQLREDFCPQHPQVTYQPVTFFENDRDLPTANGISLLFSIVDNFDGLEGQAAYHSFIGVPFVKICPRLGSLSVLLSHEGLEETANPTCLRMFKLRDGVMAGREVCDPVQGWTYLKDVEILGKRRAVPVSAFVLPAYFDESDAVPCVYAPGYAAETILPGGIAPGGYLPVIGKGGWENRYGAMADRGTIEAKAKNDTGRAWRRRGL
jgi:hypothetical protein